MKWNYINPALLKLHFHWTAKDQTERKRRNSTVNKRQHLHSLLLICLFAVGANFMLLFWCKCRTEFACVLVYGDICPLCQAARAAWRGFWFVLVHAFLLVHLCVRFDFYAAASVEANSMWWTGVDVIGDSQNFALPSSYFVLF